MKSIVVYIICLFFILLIGCRDTSKRIDLKETYSYKEARPFGGKVAYELFKSTYPTTPIQLKNESFYQTAAWTSDTNALYINISKNYYVNEEDVQAMLDFIYKGNTAFIAANDLGSILLEKLFFTQSDSVGFRDRLVFLRDTKVSLVPALSENTDTVHQYYYQPFYNYFSVINTRYSRIVGYNDKGNPNFVVFFWGKGRLFLHCEARAFSNYFLLQKNNIDYLLQPLQILPENPQHIYWDDHYNKINYGNKRGDQNKGSSASIFNYPSLKWAFWILIFSLLAYIIFNGKRKQRIISVLKPIKNTSIEFAQAMSELYLKEKNNKLMAEKMMHTFHENIRNKYFINTQSNPSGFEERLSKRAGISLEDTQKMTQYFIQINEQEKVSDEELQYLNQIIQQFNKN